MSLGVTTLTWKVACEQGGDFQFGLWFSPTSPVPTSGPPDQTLPYTPGAGDYQATRRQTAGEYAAVAAIQSPDKGPVAEIPLPWNPNAPASPSDQYAFP